MLFLPASVFAQSKPLADNFDSPPKEYRPETKLQELRITFQGNHALDLISCHFLAQAHIHNYEAKAGFVCRSLEHVSNPGYNEACKIINGESHLLSQREMFAYPRIIGVTH